MDKDLIDLYLADLAQFWPVRGRVSVEDVTAVAFGYKDEQGVVAFNEVTRAVLVHDPPPWGEDLGIAKLEQMAHECVADGSVGRPVEAVVPDSLRCEWDPLYAAVKKAERQQRLQSEAIAFLTDCRRRVSAMADPRRTIEAHFATKKVLPRPIDALEIELDRDGRSAFPIISGLRDVLPDLARLDDAIARTVIRSGGAFAEEARGFFEGRGRTSLAAIVDLATCSSALRREVEGCLETVGEERETSVLRALGSALGNTDARTRSRAGRWLEKLGEAGMTALRKLLDDPACRDEALKVLHRHADRERCYPGGPKHVEEIESVERDRDMGITATCTNYRCERCGRHWSGPWSDEE